MKKSIVILSLLAFAIMVNAQQAAPNYDIATVDGKVMLTIDQQKVPITSNVLGEQAKDVDSALQKLTSRRAILAELLALDEQIEQLKGQKTLLESLLNKAKNAEAALASEQKKEPEKPKGGG